MSADLPPGRCASAWGGRETGPCLYDNDEVLSLLAAERERWKACVKEAFYEGFTSPQTYNDKLCNSADEAWAAAKESLLKDAP